MISSNMLEDRQEEPLIVIPTNQNLRRLLPLSFEEKKSSGNKSSNDDAKSDATAGGDHDRGYSAVLPQLALLRRSSGTLTENGEVAPPVISGLLATGTLAAPASAGRNLSFHRKGERYVSSSSSASGSGVSSSSANEQPRKDQRIGSETQQQPHPPQQQQPQQLRQDHPASSAAAPLLFPATNPLGPSISRVQSQPLFPTAPMNSMGAPQLVFTQLTAADGANVHRRASSFETLPTLPLSMPLQERVRLLAQCTPGVGAVYGDILQSWPISARFGRRPQFDPARLAPSRFAMAKFSRTLTEAFNVGDMSVLEGVLSAFLTRDCTLRTPSTRGREISGKQYVITMFDAILEDHPDGVIDLKRIGYDERSRVLSCRLCFTGTRSLVSPGSRLYIAPEWSLLDEMNLTIYSPLEIAHIQQLDQYIRLTGCPHLVLRSGVIHFTYDETYMIARVAIEWQIISFRPIEI